MTISTNAPAAVYPAVWGELLQYWPEGAQALAQGKEARLQCEDIDCCAYTPYYCDDCNTWHKSWSGWEHYIEDNQLWAGEVTCDSDGDWDCCIAYVYGSDEHRDAEKAERGEDHYVKGYAAYVIETGTDPLEDYNIKSEETVEKRYMAHGNKVGDQCKIVLLIADDGQLVYPKQFDEQIREFFMCDESGTITDMDWNETLAVNFDWAKAWLNGTDDRLIINCKIEVKQPIPNYEDRLKEAAKKNL